MMLVMMVEFTRAALMDRVVDIAIGRVLEVVLVAAFGFFWRALVRAVVRLAQRIVREVCLRVRAGWVALREGLRAAIRLAREVYQGLKNDVRAEAHRNFLLGSTSDWVILPG